MAEIYIVRQKLKGALWTTGVLVALSAGAAIHFHNQLQYLPDESKFFLSMILTGSFSIAWIIELLTLIFSGFIFDRKLPRRGIPNQQTNHRFPWWIFPAIILAVFISAMSIFLYKEADRKLNAFELWGKNKLERLEAKLSAEPELINQPNQNEMTLLMLATHAKQTHLLTYLIENGADVLAKDIEGRTAVFYAVDNPAILKQLIEAGALPNEFDHYKKAPIHYATETGNLDSVKLLIEAGADANTLTPSLKNPIFLATEQQNIELIQYLSEQGANITQHDNQNNTVLHVSISLKNIELSKLLLELGAKIAAFNSYELTPLHLAAAQGSVEATQLLLPYTYKVDLTFRNSNSPLYYALSRHHLEVAQLLIDHGADVNLRLKNGSTNLHNALKDGDPDLIKFLINNRANPDLPDRSDLTARDIMEKRTLTTFLELLEPLPESDDQAKSNDLHLITDHQED